MTQPFHHYGDVSGHGTVSNRWTRDQDNWQMQTAGGLQLGQRPSAAGVFGDDMGDGMGAQKVHVGFNREGAAIKDHFGIGQRQGGGGCIDKAKQVKMLGLCGEGGQGLLADGKEYPGRNRGQSGNRRFGIGDMQPVIPRLRAPFRAFMGNKGRASHATGFNRVSADLHGKGMRGIDNMGDLRINDVVGKTFDATITAKAGGQGLLYRVGGAASVGKDGVYSGIRERMGKGCGFGCATQKKDAHYG
jgi:hypothetical protein